MHVIHQWRFLKALKRAGRGHYPNGVSETGAGELTVMCPACPNPDVNLPPDWNDRVARPKQ